MPILHEVVLECEECKTKAKALASYDIWNNICISHVPGIWIVMAPARVRCQSKCWCRLTPKCRDAADKSRSMHTDAYTSVGIDKDIQLLYDILYS